MRKIFEVTALIAVFAVTTPTASATGIGTMGIQHIPDRMTDVRPILVVKKLSASKSRKRVAKRLQGGLAISPSAAKGDGYPTPGKAFQACGGAGNVFVMYDIGINGEQTNYSYHCV